ncbi:MAG: zinc-binding alcohol dehydrogenase [Erysipelotrichaceae bacterium]|nr:zinc-binding alcohol dehydrogenase [Erysipelotrichaceae bacterium]
MERRFVILTGKAQAEIHSEPFDVNQELKDNEAIIDTTTTMISAGTELSRVYAIKQGFSYPVYPGYTAVGKVLRKGKGLTHLEVGDRVFYSGPHASINKYSHVGTTQGAKILKIDERMSDTQACMIQMGLIAMNAVTACHGNLTDTVAVYGLGTIGIVAALLLQKQGMRVICFDPVETRCQEARNAGLKECYSVAADKQVETLKQLTNGKGAEISVDVSGISPAIVNAILGTAKYGQVILLGSPRASFSCDITPVLNAIHMKMLDVKGAFNQLNPFPQTDGTRQNVLKDFETVQRLILDGTIDADKLISHVIAPEEIMSAYHGLMHEKELWHCAVIDWTK